MSTITKAIDIKLYSLTELASIYGVTNRAIKNWIIRHDEAIGQKIGRLYTDLQVKIIFENWVCPVFPKISLYFFILLQQWESFTNSRCSRY